MTIVISIGIFQAILCMFFLLQMKSRDKSDFLLLAIITCVTIHLSIKFIIFSFVEEQSVRDMMNTFIGYCYGPFVYFFTLQKANLSLKIEQKFYLLLPFFIASIVYFSAITALTIDLEKGKFILDWYNRISYWTLIPFTIILCMKAIVLTLKNKFSAADNRLALSMSIGFLTINVLALSYTLVFEISSYSLDPILLRTLVYAILVIICVLIIKYRFVDIKASQNT